MTTVEVVDVAVHTTAKTEEAAESEQGLNSNEKVDQVISPQATPEKFEIDIENTPGLLDQTSVSDDLSGHRIEDKKKVESSDESIILSSSSEEQLDFHRPEQDKVATGSNTTDCDDICANQLLREFVHDDGECSVECSSQMTSVSETSYKPNFQAGDHIIRWKLLKAVLYPIQIHGIVLSVDVIQGEADTTGKPMLKMVIADFGYTKSQSYNEDEKAKKGKGVSTSINKMMQSYYKAQERNESKRSFNNLDINKRPNNPNRAIALERESIRKDDHSADDDELKLNRKGKRFRVITLTEPKQIKKWSKINYGSLFSNDGKLAKMKKWIMAKNEILKRNRGDKDLPDNGLRPDSIRVDNIERMMSPTTIDSKNVCKKEVNDHDPPPPIVDKIDNQSTTLAHLMTEANKIERRSRSRRRFSSLKRSKNLDSNSSDAFQTKSKSNMNLFSKSWFGGSSRKEEKSLTKEEKSLYSLLTASPDRAEENDDEKCAIGSVRTLNSQSTTEHGHILPSPPTTEEKGQKLPKCDPREIVLARTKYILAQQDLPQSESTLPPYHVLYSNSECLAVWCKTGHFSTLQAAVFLHSTAVGNAKSTVALTAAVSATQPWLIPLVGIYGIVAVGMPYYFLKKCHVKWKESEKSLTDGFWSTADPLVYVAAIENWSRLGLQQQSK